MARKKTKQQKLKTSKKRATEGTSSSLTQMVFDSSILPEQVDEAVGNKIESNIGVKSLYEFDPKLLRFDLRKTLLLSLLVFGMEMGFYLWLK